MNNRQVAHAFAHGEQNAKGSNYFIEDGTLYSYGHHFPVARMTLDRDGIERCLVTTRGYSVTTSKHISLTWSAVHHLNTFAVDDVTAESKAQHKANLDDMRREYEELILQASRARTNGPWLLEQAEERLTKANDYAKAFRLGTRLKPANVEQIAERAEKQRKAAEAKRREELAKLQAEQAERLTRWLAGENVQGGMHALPVRLRLVGDTVQTSHGAQFPAADARKIWPMITRVREANEGIAHFTREYRLGMFRIDSISAYGDVKAGCHLVKFEACRELAVTLGLV